jgi:hypothetical protein
MQLSFYKKTDLGFSSSEAASGVGFFDRRILPNHLIDSCLNTHCTKSIHQTLMNRLMSPEQVGFNATGCDPLSAPGQ